jgi:hypothetical protein
MHRATWIVVGVMGIAACAGMLGTRRPKQPGFEIRQSHAVHKDLPCEMCHEEIADSTKITDSLKPKEAKCLECHAEKREQKECGYCHMDPAQPAGYPPEAHNIIFPHKTHLKLVNNDCSSCHPKLSEFSRPGRTPPTMQACTKCHEHKVELDEGNCKRCHVDLKRFPLKPVTAFSHSGDFVHQHRNVARTSADACTQCHDQTFCSDCHGKTNATRVELKFSENVTSDFIHRGDYLTRHSLEARADQALCQRCHGVSYCVDCHKQENVGPGGKDPRSPHPAGWALPGPTSHAASARREIVNCASCHDQGPATNGIACHKVGGIGGNPHPTKWLGKHSLPEAYGTAMCMYCHPQ